MAKPLTDSRVWPVQMTIGTPPSWNLVSGSSVSRGISLSVLPVERSVSSTSKTNTFTARPYSP
jgi:hypothetical protein